MRSEGGRAGGCIRPGDDDADQNGRESPRAEDRLAQLTAAGGPLRRALEPMCARLLDMQAMARLCYAGLRDDARERAWVAARQLQDLAHAHQAFEPPLDKCVRAPVRDTLAGEVAARDPHLVGCGEVDAFELDRRLRAAIRREQTLDAAIAPLLRNVTSPRYEWDHADWRRNACCRFFRSTSTAPASDPRRRTPTVCAGHRCRGDPATRLARAAGGASLFLCHAQHRVRTTAACFGACRVDEEEGRRRRVQAWERRGSAQGRENAPNPYDDLPGGGARYGI